MTADQVIELRKHWLKFNYREVIPEATVLAERDWLAYVQAMASTVPSEEVVWPDEKEAAWAWPDGVLIVLAEPIEMSHTIISQDRLDGSIERVDPHQEKQTVAALIVGASFLMQSRDEDGKLGPEVPAHPILWIGADPTDIISGGWVPGVTMHPPGGRGISESTRFLVSVITALGHRLTSLYQPPVAGRGERRRVQRELPSLRVLGLSSGASVSRSEEPGTVEWSHRWMVRGHWRLQPYGPRRELRKMRWIDPYVKGPEDKPLDVRPTIWHTSPVEK